MQKVKEIKGFESFDVYKNSIIVQNKEGIQLLNKDLSLTFLIEGHIHSSKILDNKLFYQLDNSSNLHIYDNNAGIKDNIGYTLHSALYCTPYIYIYGGRDDTSIFLDINLKFVVRAPEYCFASYRNYLFDYDKNTITCYQLNNRLWNYTHVNDSKLKIISGYQDKLIIYSESGELFALELQTGNLSWKYAERSLSPNSLCGDTLYSLSREELVEINASTGEKIRSKHIKSLEEKEKISFNKIKVYDDFIFCTDTFNAIVILDRKTLEVKEILRFENHLINRDYTLQWVNNRLYVQDVEHVIHIFE